MEHPLSQSPLLPLHQKITIEMDETTDKIKALAVPNWNLSPLFLKHTSPYFHMMMPLNGMSNNIKCVAYLWEQEALVLVLSVYITH